MQGLCRRNFASLFSEGVSTEPDHAQWARRKRRDTLFAESLALWCRRHCVSLWLALKLIRTLGPVKFFFMLLWEPAGVATTSSYQPLDHGHGFCGFGSTLAPTSIMGAYLHGLYPRSLFGAVSWWSPSTRLGIVPSSGTALATSSALLDNAPLRVTFDRDFDRVVASCAQSLRGNGIALSNPIAPTLMQAFAALHEAGVAHSFEVWNTSDQLVSGGYGISVGGIFVCEQLFACTAEVAAVALRSLNRCLAEWGYAFIDLRTRPPQSVDLPITALDRSDFLRMLTDHLGKGKYGEWRMLPQMDGQTG